MVKPPTAQGFRASTFSLRQILVAVVAVAIGLAIWRLPKGDWIDVPLATLSFYYVLSLFRHASAARQLLSKNPDLPRDQRWGGRLQFVILIGFACLLIATWIIRTLAANELLLRQPHGDVLGYVQLAVLPRDLAVLTMLAAAGMSYRRTRPTRAVRIRQSIYAVLVAAAVMIGLTLYEADTTLITFIVYIAVQGIELAQPAKLLPPELNVSNAVRVRQFTLASLAGLAVLVMNLLVIPGLTKLWKWPLQRCALLVLLAIGLSAEIWLSSELACRAIWRLSPAMAEAISVPPLVIALVVGLVLIFALAVLWPNLAQPGQSEPPAMSGNCGRWFHESWVGSLALGACTTTAVVGQWIRDLNLLVTSSYWRTAPRPLDLGTIVSVMTQHPSTGIGVAAAIGGFALAWIRWRAKDDPIKESLPSINPSQLAITFLALVVSIIASAPILAAASFSYWFIRFGKAF
jgi:hypothetical protein